jgi:hypothetical protein
VQHLFFECHFSRFIWSIVHITFGIQPPSTILNMFGSWLNGFQPKLRSKNLVGTTAICWILWLNKKNDMVFHGGKSNILFLQVIFRVTYWIHS